MQSVQEYMDAAKEAQGYTSDRELARALNITSGPINQLRTGRTLPKDETMIAIATLAGEDVNVALLRLNIWRSTAPGTAKYYKNILTQLQKTVAAIIVAIALNFSPGLRIQEAQAAGTPNSGIEQLAGEYTSRSLLISLSQVRVLFGEPFRRTHRLIKSLLGRARSAKCSFAG